MPRGFDQATMSHAFERPGQDTRQWGSYGTVEVSTPGGRSVNFDPDFGPLVSVRLQPSGVPVVCRVASFIAGNGEGSWYPFADGDEVWVEIPEGDELAGCVITGRLNQQIDKWPTMVAGNDATTNTFGFMRMRTPFIVETASSYLIRSAATGAFLGITSAGAVTVGNSDNAFLSLSHDFIGLQSGDASCLMQINVDAKTATIEANGVQLILGMPLSYLYTSGNFQIGTSGNQAAEHATSIEAVSIVVSVLLQILGTASSGGGPSGAAALATQLAALTSPTLAQAAVAEILAASAALPLEPSLTAAIAAALATKKVPGVIPGIGCPGLLIG